MLNIVASFAHISLRCKDLTASCSLLSGKVASCTQEVWFILYNHKHLHHSGQSLQCQGTCLYYSRGAHEPGYSLYGYLHMLTLLQVGGIPEDTVLFHVQHSLVLRCIENALLCAGTGTVFIEIFTFIPGTVIRLSLVFISDSVFSELCSPIIISEPCISHAPCGSYLKCIK